MLAAALPFWSGFIGGGLFPPAFGRFLEGRRPSDAHLWSGTLYAVDLAGSAAGGLLVSAVLVPVIGVYATFAMLSVIILACFLLFPSR